MLALLVHTSVVEEQPVALLVARLPASIVLELLILLPLAPESWDSMEVCASMLDL